MPCHKQHAPRIRWSSDTSFWRYASRHTFKQIDWLQYSVPVQWVTHLEVGIFTQQLLEYVAQVVVVVITLVTTRRRRRVVTVVHVLADHLQVGKVLLQPFYLTLLRPYLLPKFVACTRHSTNTNAQSDHSPGTLNSSWHSSLCCSTNFEHIFFITLPVHYTSIHNCKNVQNGLVNRKILVKIDTRPTTAYP